MGFVLQIQAQPSSKLLPHSTWHEPTLTLRWGCNLHIMEVFLHMLDWIQMDPFNGSSCHL